MAIIDKKQKRWYSKSTFDSLDKTAIPVGTEIQVTGPIGANDLDSELLVGINGKLTKPTNPSAESAVTMLADGTVGTKPLSEFGGKSYKHHIEISAKVIDTTDTPFNGLIYIDIYSNSQTAFTLDTLNKSGLYSCIVNNEMNGRRGVACIEFYKPTISILGATCMRVVNGDVLPLYYEIPYQKANMTDTVTEL